MQLSLRLQTLAGMVTEGNFLVDVGCDHGYLPVYLVSNGKIPGALAMDVRTGPLSRAQEHIRQYGLSDYIETRLSDGLAALHPGEGDTLVIAGMGGFLMERILTDGAALLGNFRELILQPQSDLAHFRHFIRNLGFEIAQEEMVFEDGKYYPMIRVVPAGEADAVEYLPVEEAFGKYLLAGKHPVLLQYLKRELVLCEKIYENLKNASGETASARRSEIREREALLKEALQYYERTDQTQNR
jgi:tRNA (adenine22-N1)-methyltransferase